MLPGLLHVTVSVALILVVGFYTSTRNMFLDAGFCLLFHKTRSRASLHFAQNEEKYFNKCFLPTLNVDLLAGSLRVLVQPSVWIQIGFNSPSGGNRHLERKANSYTVFILEPRCRRSRAGALLMPHTVVFDNLRGMLFES